MIAGVRAALDYRATPYEVINIGNNHTLSLRQMIEGLEAALNLPATIERLPEQPGDVPRTWANIDKARNLLGYRPRTTYREGVLQYISSLL